MSLEALRARWRSALAGDGGVLAVDPALPIDDELRALGARVLLLEELVADEQRGGGDPVEVADAVVARVLAAAPVVLAVDDPVANPALSAATMLASRRAGRAALLVIVPAPGGPPSGETDRAGSLHLEAGRAALRSIELDRARASFARAVAAFRQAGEAVAAAAALRDLGTAEHLAGRWGEAERAWRAALRLDERWDERPAAALDALALAGLACERGDREAAAAALEAAHQDAPADLLDMLRGDLALLAGDRAAASEAWRRAIDRGPAADRALALRRRLAELDLSRGRVDAAVEQLIELCRAAQHAEDRVETARLHRLTAAALRRSGDRESAGWFLDRAREIAAAGLAHEGARVDLETAELAAAEGHEEQIGPALERAAARLAALGARPELAQLEARRRAATPAAPAGGATGASIDAVVAELARAAGAARCSLLALDEPAAAEEQPAVLRALAAAVPMVDGGLLFAPVLLDERPLAVARLEPRGAAPDLALVGALAARVAVAMECRRFRAGALRQGELRATLAHQIRNPLAGILGFSDLLPEEAAELPPSIVQLMERIHSDARRLKDLVEKLLDRVAERGDGGDAWLPERVPLAPLLDGLVRRFAPLAARRAAELTVEAGEDVDAFAARERLYLGVAVLALDAVDAGGRVALSARGDPRPPPAPTAPHGWIRIELQRATEVADASSEAYEIAAEIARRHGGALRIAERDAGAVVELVVPAARPR